MTPNTIRGGGTWDSTDKLLTLSASAATFQPSSASSSNQGALPAPRDIPFSQSVPLLPGHSGPKISGPQYFKASPPAAEEDAFEDEEQFQKWYENKLKNMFKLKSNTENDDDIINYRKQLIPDAFTIQGLPSAAGFDQHFDHKGSCRFSWYRRS